MRLDNAQDVLVGSNRVLAIVKNNYVRYSVGHKNIIVHVDHSEEKESYKIVSEAFIEALQGRVIFVSDNRLVGKEVGPQIENVEYVFEGSEDIDINGIFEGLDIDGVTINGGVNPNFTFANNTNLKTVNVNPTLIKDRKDFSNMFNRSNVEKVNFEEWDMSADDIDTTEMFARSKVAYLSNHTLKVVGEMMCYRMNNSLKKVDFPNVTKIMMAGFDFSEDTTGVNYENLEEIARGSGDGHATIYDSSLTGEIVFKNLKNVNRSILSSKYITKVHFTDKIESFYRPFTHYRNRGTGEELNYPSVSLVTIAKRTGIDDNFDFETLADDGSGQYHPIVYVPYEAFDDYVAHHAPRNAFRAGTFLKAYNFDGSAPFSVNADDVASYEGCLVLKDEVKYLDQWSFYQTPLKSIWLYGIEICGLFSFYQTRYLSYIYFDSLKTYTRLIEDLAPYGKKYTTPVVDIVLNMQTPPQMDDTFAVGDTIPDVRIFVPDSAIDAYKTKLPKNAGRIFPMSQAPNPENNA